MGKPKFKSSMKSLQQAITSLKPQGPKPINWICIHQTNTHSFREMCNVMHDQNNASSSFSTSSSSTSGKNIPCIMADYPEEDLSSSAMEMEPRRNGLINSKRFFFAPCITNSILEQPGQDIDVDDDEHEVNVFGTSSSTLTMEMTSANPYEDFKESMEEMVEAHGIKDWSSLEQLLQCYLSLNDKNSHDTIVSAFVDLVIALIHGEEKITSSSCSSSTSKTTSSLSSSLCAYLSS